MAWQPSTSHETSSLIAFPVPQMCVVVFFSLNLTLFLKFSSSYLREVEEHSSLKSFWLWNYELSANSPSSGFKFAFRQRKSGGHTAICKRLDKKCSRKIRLRYYVNQSHFHQIVPHYFWFCDDHSNIFEDSRAFWSWREYMYDTAPSYLLHTVNFINFDRLRILNIITPASLSSSWRKMEVLIILKPLL